MDSKNIFKRILYYMNPKHIEPKMVKLWAFWIVFWVVLFLVPTKMVTGSFWILVPLAGLFVYALVTKDVMQSLFLVLFSYCIYAFHILYFLYTYRMCSLFIFDCISLDISSIFPCVLIRYWREISCRTKIQLLFYYCFVTIQIEKQPLYDTFSSPPLQRRRRCI